MTQTGDQIRLAPKGHIYVAPLGSLAPVDVTTAWDAAWKELGFADDSGVDLTPKVNTQPIAVWQSGSPGKIVIQSAEFTADFNLAQTNKDTTNLFYYGSDWVVSGGIGRLSIPASPDTDERMLGIEWTEDAITNRLVIPRGMAGDRQKVSLNRKTAQMFGLSFEALELADELAFILTNDPAIVS